MVQPTDLGYGEGRIISYSSIGYIGYRTLTLLSLFDLSMILRVDIIDFLKIPGCEQPENQCFIGLSPSNMVFGIVEWYSYG